MKANRQWMVRNLGFDPLKTPPPTTTFAFAKAASTGARKISSARSSISTPKSTSGLRFLAFTTATGLSRYVDVPWPAGLAPRTGPKPRAAARARCPAPTCW